MDNSMVKSAARNEPVDVPLCGHVYQFKNPPRMEGEVLFGKALQIAGRYGFDSLVNSDGDIDTDSIGIAQGGLLMQATPDIIDYLCLVLHLDRKAKKQIQNDYEREELMAAFGQIMGILGAPLGGGSLDTGQETEKNPTCSMSGKPETDSCNDTESTGA